MKLHNHRLVTKSVAATLAGLLFSVAAHADPHFGRVSFSDSDEVDPAVTFEPDTAKIYMHIELVDWDKDAVVTGTWIAEKAEGAPPNYTIDTATVQAKAGFEDASFSLSKPNKGWPVGSYRVDVSVDGKKVKSEHFSIEK